MTTRLTLRPMPSLPGRLWRGLLLAACTLTAAAAGTASRPNLVYILCDDLGYGDVACLNPQGRIPTPHLDRVGREGMIFTDAHASSAVCTPSRYSLLTGRYNWRSRMKHGVLNGYSPRLIEPGRATVASFLREHGYATACFGKWHLGMNWPQNDGSAPGSSANPKKVDYTRPIEGGPTAVGFDTFFGISASLDMAPYVFIENDRATEIPTAEKEWIRKGSAGPNFEAIDVLPVVSAKAVDYIRTHADSAKSGKPFFLYLPLTSPHTPILPTAGWKGKSGLNAYADFVMQTDAVVGQVLDALDRHGIADNTLVIVTSDNGCSPSANYAELLARQHNPSHVFRGTKSDIWEGGHRVPYLVRWPSRVKAGSVCHQLTALQDLFATCAEILGASLPETAAEDSVSQYAALAGRTEQPLRASLVHSAIFGALSLRQGNWKLIFAADSGGWSDPKPGSEAAAKLPRLQLYDLAQDIGENRNLEAERPEVVATLTQAMERILADGRSTPGPPQPNTGEVTLYSTRTAQPARAPSAGGTP
ncbi:MAG: arylsulfatase [Opitutaceae bacterium]